MLLLAEPSASRRRCRAGSSRGPISGRPSTVGRSVRRSGGESVIGSLRRSGAPRRRRQFALRLLRSSIMQPSQLAQPPRGVACALSLLRLAASHFMQMVKLLHARCASATIHHHSFALHITACLACILAFGASLQ